MSLFEKYEIIAYKNFFYHFISFFSIALIILRFSTFDNEEDNKFHEITAELRADFRNPCFRRVTAVLWHTDSHVSGCGTVTCRVTWDMGPL